MSGRTKIPEFVLGVDGGTTKTIALIADLNGNILAAARGDGCNWTGSDVEIPMLVVTGVAKEALQQANVLPQNVSLGMFSLAGADWPEDCERRTTVLVKANIARRIIVKNDAFGGLRAGTRLPYGVVIAAGTGANTAIIAPDGREWAFGYYQTDGGASDISEEAIRAVLRAEDGRGPSTLLTDMVLKQFQFSCVDDLLKALVAKKVDRVTQFGLCPRVFEASCSGDEVASEIIVRHGLILAEYAVAAISRFGMLRDEFDVVLAGSVFKGAGPLLIDTITMAIHRVAPHARVLRSCFEPVVGAILLAYDALHLPVSESIYNNLAATCPGAQFFKTDTG
jgi:N-acetylglucosamine kinase-like BadF-type ATPase